MIPEVAESKEPEENVELNLKLKAESEEMFDEVEPHKLVQVKLETDEDELTFACDGIVENEVPAENSIEHDLNNPSTSQGVITEDVQVADVETYHSMEADEDLIPEVESFSKKQHTYTEAQQYMCDFCRFRSICKELLVKHLRTHSGEKLLDCKFCERKFAVKAMLKRHEQIHKGEKPFGCSQCNHKTRRKVDLERHIRIHNGDKKLKCSSCNFVCTKQSDLDRHVRTHTGEKPFTCLLCPYKATRNFHLTRHVRKVHKNS